MMRWIRLRRMYLALAAWPLTIGLLSFISSVALLANPEALRTTSVALAFHHTAIVYGWNIGYGVGGFCMAAGILARRKDIDAFGLMVFMGASLLNTVALWETHPPLKWLGLTTYLGLSIAAGLRAFAITRLGLP